MSTQQDQLLDVVEAARNVIFLVQTSPPHVRPWLRGIEAAAEHVHLEVSVANKRASARFLTWLLAGFPEEAEVRK